jgi:hypothetical protein
MQIEILNPCLTFLPAPILAEVRTRGIVRVYHKYVKLTRELEVAEGLFPSAPQNIMVHNIWRVPVTFMVDVPSIYLRNIDHYRFIRDVLGLCETHWVKKPRESKRPKQVFPEENVSVKNLTPRLRVAPSSVNISECPVCLSDRMRIFQETNCGHHFCLACTKKHFSKHTECPICRTEVVQLKRVT